MTDLLGMAGRTVLVTGGASGIGADHVRAFAGAGARVAFIDIQDEPADALVAELGDAVAYYHCDLTNLTALKATIEKVGAERGRISALVSNAAVDLRHSLADITEEAFDKMMQLNLRHVLFAAQYVVPQMRELGGGAIINTSSVAWMRGIANLQLYAAAKAGIVGFTNALAREVGVDRIRVNALLPGFVPTPRQQALWTQTPTEAESIRAMQCLPDYVTGKDVANAALFLCSDASKMITKQCLLVNGGSF